MHTFSNGKLRNIFFEYSVYGKNKFVGTYNISILCIIFESYLLFKKTSKLSKKTSRHLWHSKSRSLNAAFAGLVPTHVIFSPQNQRDVIAK